MLHRARQAQSSRTGASSGGVRHTEIVERVEIEARCIAIWRGEHGPRNRIGSLVDSVNLLVVEQVKRFGQHFHFVAFREAELAGHPQVNIPETWHLVRVPGHEPKTIQAESGARPGEYAGGWRWSARSPRRTADALHKRIAGANGDDLGNRQAVHNPPDQRI